jgi:hypothetical protein
MAVVPAAFRNVAVLKVACLWKIGSRENGREAVNREDKRSRRYRDRDFAKFERSRRYRDR